MAVKNISEPKFTVVLAVFVFFGMLILTINAYAKDITAASCSAADIQAAADEVEAMGGGSVNIPACNVTHSAKLKLSDGVNLFGAGQDKTILNGANIQINTRFYGRLNRPFRISGLTLKNNSHFLVDSSETFRIDHLTVESASGSAIRIKRSKSALIDHCTIKVAKGFYGITVVGSTKGTYADVWEPDVSKLLGKPTAIFIEDCNFYGANHSVVGHGNAHYVVRHCTFRDSYGSWKIDAHGPGYGAPCGTRLIEVYNNLLDAPIPGYTKRGIGVRGGSAVIFNNVINKHDNGVLLTLDGSGGDDTFQMIVQDVWIWNNTFNNLGDSEVIVWDVNDMGELRSIDHIKENRNYFLRQPSQELDGFTYKPYTYPHPFQKRIFGKGDSEAPNAPAALCVKKTAG